MTAVAAEASGLRKRLATAEAVRDLSFAVPEGSVFGLVGRNGAGKTTTIRLLLGLLRPDAGHSTVLGEDSLALSRATRRRIGYLSEEPFPYDDLPLPGLLRFVSAFFDDWDWPYAESLVARLDVPQDRTLAKMSRGERRRAELLLVLAQRPDILVLDDPWLGLDAAVRRQFLVTALDLARDEGRTVLFTSHVLSDVERIVDRIALIDRGLLRTGGTLDEVKGRTKRLVLSVNGRDPATIVVPGEVSRRVGDGEIEVVTEAFTPALEERLRGTMARVDVVHLNLEEIFWELVGRPPAEEPR
jgi:ABC-2 type transport system ATP-binding protein